MVWAGKSVNSAGAWRKRKNEIQLFKVNKDENRQLFTVLVCMTVFAVTSCGEKKGKDKFEERIEKAKESVEDVVDDAKDQIEDKADEVGETLDKAKSKIEKAKKKLDKANRD